MENKKYIYPIWADYEDCSLEYEYCICVDDLSDDFIEKLVESRRAEYVEAWNEYINYEE